MPNISLIEHPERLTKERLKKELKKKGIPLPEPHALKAEYVNLYKKKVLSKKSTGFSSDEEEQNRVSRIKTRSVKDSHYHEVSVKLERIDSAKTMTIDGIDVSELSDLQLGEELKLHGFNIGPIGPTTRKLYERRLEKILQTAGTGDATENGQDEYSDQDSADDENEADIEAEERVAMDTRNKRRSLLMTTNKDGSATRRRAMRATKPEPLEPEEEQEVVKEEPLPPSGDKIIPARSKRRWMPVWIQIVIVASLIAFAYLVMMSMESNPSKRIPG